MTGFCYICRRAFLQDIAYTVCRRRNIFLIRIICKNSVQGRFRFDIVPFRKQYNLDLIELAQKNGRTRQDNARRDLPLSPPICRNLIFQLESYYWISTARPERIRDPRICCCCSIVCSNLYFDHTHCKTRDPNCLPFFPEKLRFVRTFCNSLCLSRFDTAPWGTICTLHCKMLSKIQLCHCRSPGGI